MALHFFIAHGEGLLCRWENSLGSVLDLRADFTELYLLRGNMWDIMNRGDLGQSVAVVSHGIKPEHSVPSEISDITLHKHYSRRIYSYCHFYKLKI